MHDDVFMDLLTEFEFMQHADKKRTDQNRQHKGEKHGAERTDADIAQYIEKREVFGKGQEEVIQHCFAP